MILLALYLLLCLVNFLVAIFSTSLSFPRKFFSASRCSLVFFTSLLPPQIDSNSTALAALGKFFRVVFNADFSHRVFRVFQASHNHSSRSRIITFCFWLPSFQNRVVFILPFFFLQQPYRSQHWPMICGRCEDVQGVLTLFGEVAQDMTIGLSSSVGSSRRKSRKEQEQKTMTTLNQTWTWRWGERFWTKCGP